MGWKASFPLGMKKMGRKEVWEMRMRKMQAKRMRRGSIAAEKKA